VIAYPLRHRPTCTGARPVNGFAGRYGDQMLYCADCQAVGHAAATEAGSTPQAPRPKRRNDTQQVIPEVSPDPLAEEKADGRVAGTRYVCGHHLDERVDHRSRGCRRCAQSRPAR